VFISFEQLVLLLVLALILFGPEKLPEIAQKIAQWMVKLRQASSDLTQQYQDVLNPALPPPAPRPLPPEVFTCPHCSHTMQERFTFCPHCGQRHEEPPWYICPQCNRDLDAEFLFCPSCGQHRVEGASHYLSREHHPDPRLITCPQCTRKVEADLLFCTGCGHPLEKSPDAPQSEDQPLKSGLAAKDPGT
jgi:predicted amidophosphoribosyltransferase